MTLSTHTPHVHPPQPPAPSFLSRLSIAFRAFFRILAHPDYAARVDGLRLGADLEPPQTAAPAAPAPTPAPTVNYNDAALQLLALLQRDARLIDFTQENLTRYSDADIGGAARVVHEGCCKVLREHFTIVPVRQEAEGSRIILHDGFDARAIRLTGNVVGKAPFLGSLSHRGWRAVEVRLPKLAESHDVTVLAQAEVEL